jgi:hypothetical protein
MNWRILRAAAVFVIDILEILFSDSVNHNIPLHIQIMIFLIEICPISSIPSLFDY